MDEPEVGIDGALVYLVLVGVIALLVVLALAVICAAVMGNG